MTKQKSRWLSGLVAAAMLFTSLAVPIPQQTTASAHWADQSLTKLRDWGVMRGDQNGSMEPDRKITRAEFVSMVNRAFGYKKLGNQPFKDVKGTEWYANEINIGFNQGYFKGSSKSTASPNDPLTREEAAVLVGRNLMLTPDESENLQFKDGRSLSAWSRGIVTAAAKKSILRGQTDGTFRPQASITRGEVASMLERTIGTPINQSGSRSLGMVHGNVMISAPDVELNDTTINGDLYITAGVDLGFVKLNNVRVTGQIIAAGAGVSNSEANSILLRNTTAGEMIIDSPNNVAISVRADGETNIGKTFVRTSAYLEDMCYGGNGFQMIEIDGEEGTRVDLTGNFKDVVLKSPKGMVALGRGTIKKLSVDEKAFGAMVNIDEDAVINELYLDTGTTVTGAGDVGYVKINTEGTTMTMLPDKIEIRPGIIATVAGQQMTSKDALLASSYPHIRAGYPKVNDIAPNAANALVNTNKTGTMYWGITYKADNALSSEELINPPSYGAKALNKGQTKIQQAEVDIQTAISSLKTDTEYTLSVVLKDTRGNVSQRKSRTFRTPDNTIPNFAPGYPRIVKDGYVDDDHTKDFYAQVEAVITKNSTLYYAVYNKGLPAPTLDELRTQTMSGHVKGANGKLTVKKNTPALFQINGLKEKTEYDLYLLASDGINHSSVKKLSFKTGDHTPPEFNDKYPKSDNAKEKSVDIVYSVNEDATVYWVAVKRGETYPVPPDDWEGGEVPLTSDEAKFQVMSGSNAKFKGRANAVENREGRFVISGLEIQTGYDVYLLPVDKAGNQAEEVTKIQIKTLDVIPPTAELKFDPEVNGQPLVDSDISIVFSEEIRVEVDADGKRVTLHELEGNELLEAVKRNFTFYDLERDFDSGLSKEQYTAENVICTLDDGKTILTFKGGEKPALPLLSGNKYKVEISRGVYDTSNNRIEDKSRILEFLTVFSRISQTALKETPEGMHRAFELRPQSTKVSDDIMFDLIFWSQATIDFTLMQRQPDNTWAEVKVGDVPVTGHIDENSAISLAYMKAKAKGTDEKIELTQLNQFKEPLAYGIKITKYNDRDVDIAERIFDMYSVPVAGNRADMAALAKSPAATWQTLVDEQKVVNKIGTPAGLKLLIVLSSSKELDFVGEYPNFENIGDAVVIPKVQVNQNANLYYIVAPVTGGVSTLPPVPEPAQIPTHGGLKYQPKDPLDSPVRNMVVNSEANLPAGAIRGSFKGKDEKGIGPGSVQEFEIRGLKPRTTYDVYFVLESVPAKRQSRVFYYQIKTKQVQTPKLELKTGLSSKEGTLVQIRVSEISDVWWKLYAKQHLPDQIKKALPVGNESKPGVGDGFENGEKYSRSEEFVLHPKPTEPPNPTQNERNQKLAEAAKIIQGIQAQGDSPQQTGYETGIGEKPGEEPDVEKMMRRDVTFKKLAQKQEYTMVALARNKLSGDEDGKFVMYRLDGIIPSDITSPIITSVVGARPEENPQGSGKYGDQQAIITVNFSEPLYFKKDETVGDAYVMEDKNFDPESKDQYSAQLLGPKGTMTFQSFNNGKTVQYTYQNLRIDQGVQFEQPICDKEGNIAGTFRLVLESDVFKNKDDTYSPGFVATLSKKKPVPQAGGQSPNRVVLQRVAQTLVAEPPTWNPTPTPQPSISNAPVLTGVSDALREDGKGTYSGTVTVSFSAPLYYENQNTNRIAPMTNMQFSPNATGIRDANTVCMRINGTGSGMLTNGSRSTAGAYKSVTYSISKWRIGDSMTFAAPIADENGNKVNGTFSLELTQGGYSAPSGKLQPKFVATLGSSVKP